MKLDRFELDQRAINYVYNILFTRGLTLAKYVLNEHDLNKGKIFTILPRNVSKEGLYQFTEGGKLPIPKGKIQVIKTKQQIIRIEPLPTTEDWLINWLYNYIRNCPNTIVIFEGDFKPTDPCVVKFRSHLMIYQNEIYHFVTFMNMKSKSNLIKYTINEASTFPLRGFLISIDQSNLQKWQETRVKITQNDIKLLAQNVKKIIVGAYDFESFLIWEKD